MSPLVGWYCRGIGRSRIQAPVVWRARASVEGAVCFFVIGTEAERAANTPITGGQRNCRGLLDNIKREDEQKRISIEQVRQRRRVPRAQRCGKHGNLGIEKLASRTRGFVTCRFSATL